MFAQIEYPKKLLPEELDTYLSAGWFRMRQTIFTTNFLHFNNQFYSAIWLRVKLEESIFDKKYFLLKKQNKAFRSEIIKCGPGGFTQEHENLYQIYRQSISFEVSPSLQELLYGYHSFNLFNTYQVNIFDGNSLIATGFFDIGKISAAGITSIYNPAYKKYSLGKYLMYLKMDYCKQQQLQYFYPGYVVPGYQAFDYKLKIGRSELQYLQLSSQQWIPFNMNIPLENPLQEMHEKLIQLQNEIQVKGIPCILLYYKFFEANLDPYYYGHELFDFPVFLFCYPSAETEMYTLLVYNVRDLKYHLIQCSSVINIGFEKDLRKIFDTDLLKVERELYSTSSSQQLILQL